MPRPQPFPFAALPAFSHDELRLAKRLREASRRFVRTDAIAEALSELVGEEIRIVLRRARAFDPTRTPTDRVGVAFAHADESSGIHRATLVDLEGVLAATLVAKALRQRAPRITEPSRTPTAEVAGALAALLHAALRRAHSESPLRVVAAGPAAVLARDLASSPARIGTAGLTVTVGDDAFDARVSVPLDELPASEVHRPATPERLAMLGDAPIAVPLVVATCLAGRETLGTLRAGDAFVLPSFPLATNGDHLVGPIALVAGSAERGLPGRLGEEGLLVLGSGPLVSHSWDPRGETMPGEPNPTLEVVEDAPVVVRVELGAVTMTAREWTELAPGDVLTLGRKLGDPAILRVGGVEIARGELVHVEGEYGVRILGGAGER